MQSTPRRRLRLSFSSCIWCFSHLNWYFSRNDLAVNHRRLSIFLYRQRLLCYFEDVQNLCKRAQMSLHFCVCVCQFVSLYLQSRHFMYMELICHLCGIRLQLELPACAQDQHRSCQNLLAS